MIVKLVLAILGVALLAAVTAAVIAAASTRNETVACLDDATKVLQRIAPDPPNGIPEEVTAAAKCVAVVPRLLKGRFRLTAPRGKGVVTCRNLEGWSAPAFFTFSDGLWLPRFGVTDMSLIVVVMGQNARQLLSTKKIEIGTDVSAIGGPIGRHVAPENYDRLNREMLTYSISKRAFCSSVAGRCDDSRGQKIVSSHLWPCGSHASRSEWSIASAASSSVLFGCRRWNRAKKVDPLSALGRLRTYVPHGEIGALRATFLDERHC